VEKEENESSISKDGHVGRMTTRRIWRTRKIVYTCDNDERRGSKKEGGSSGCDYR
jgi:hypothetical protein